MRWALVVVSAALFGPLAAAGALLSFFALFDGFTPVRVTAFVLGAGLATICTAAIDGAHRFASRSVASS